MKKSDNLSTSRTQEVDKKKPDYRYLVGMEKQARGLQFSQVAQLEGDK